MSDASDCYGISSRDAHGKVCQVRLQRSHDESEREYRHWIRASYGRDRDDDDGSTPEPATNPKIGNTLHAIIAGYIAAEHERLRPDDGERTQGTIGIAECWDRASHNALNDAGCGYGNKGRNAGCT
ncbi:MAG: hypothetical protein KA354_06420 [Phycisphaerae bacterium]|nr:hypothetical protein [Phycisphaerae bacterium]